MPIEHAETPEVTVPVRVLIADDHSHFRRGLRVALESWSSGIEVVGEAESGVEVVEMAAELNPDVVLLDVRMPGGDGLSAAAAILALDPTTRIVMLTVSDDPVDMTRAFDAGAAGYLLKEESLHHVRDAVLNVAAGRTWPVTAG